MQIHRRSLLVAAVLLFFTPFLRAQNATDPSGHWEGAIHVPNMEVNIQIDLARQANGSAVATFTGSTSPASRCRTSSSTAHRCAFS